MNRFEKWNELNNLNIYYCGKEKCKPKHSFSVRFKEEYLMHFIADGEGVFKVNGEEYKLKKGNAFIISNDRGYYEASETNPWTYLWVKFSGELANSFFKANGISEAHPIYMTNEPEVVAKCFEEFLQNERSNKFLMFGKFLELMGTMTDTNAHKPEENIQTTVDEYIGICKKYIKDNYYRKISMEELSACVGLEYSYIFRLFKAELGVSPGSYIINHKLSKAAEFLRNGDMNVCEVALAVGYSDRVAFSRLFAKKYGMSPQKYKLTESS